MFDNEPNFILFMLKCLASYCEQQAIKDENLATRQYHDQWMAAKIEILRCAETIRKGGE